MKNAINAVRFLSIDMIENAKSGHPGMAMGFADVITVLYSKFLRFIPSQPKWAARDRLVLSAGHGSAMLYSALYLSGYEDLTIEELKRFRQLGAKTAGHPEYGHASGIETTTGPLGQGLANAVGFAIAERISNARNATAPHKTYAIVGDGCLMEGISQEAISIAGHLKLSNLIVLFDDNGISIDGSTSLTTSDNHLLRFQASGWQTISIDGHDLDQIHSALTTAQSATNPMLIACKTTIAYGSPNKMGSHHAHGAPLGHDEIEKTRQTLNWPHQPFVIPYDILAEWRSFWLRNKPYYEAHPESQGTQSLGAIDLSQLKQKLIDLEKDESTRVSSGRIVEWMAENHPYALIGGSADLSSSTNANALTQHPITADNYSGHYIHYGVREHGMCAIMNGLALYGYTPYGSTFLVFSDYMRPAIRLAAIMRQRVIYILTHDSIGLGEDGPTHQPIEHLASLRAMPSLLTIRPCDAIETLEAWEIALSHEGPTAIILSRQSLPKLRTNEMPQCNMSKLGAYIIAEFGQGKTDVTIFCSGSEAGLACGVARLLSGRTIKVISVPCAKLFLEQDDSYKCSIINDCGIKVVIEAATLQGWAEVIGPINLAFGIEGFGLSASATDLFRYFHLCPKFISDNIEALLNKH